MPSVWYEVVAGNDLEQGDILPDLLTPRVLADLSPDGQPMVARSKGHFIVLSQTCDLINDKVPEVLVASIAPYDEFAHTSQHARTTAFQKSVVNGYDIAYFLLPESQDEPALAWSIVDFHHLRLVDKKGCHEHAKNLGQRLRLVSPYKEHFSQAFGRYMMRVALPRSGQA